MNRCRRMAKLNGCYEGERDGGAFEGGRAFALSGWSANGGHFGVRLQRRFSAPFGAVCGRRHKRAHSCRQ